MEATRTAAVLLSPASARQSPSSMFDVKYLVPVPGITSTWIAMPDTSLSFDPS
jgi:hypothetical protein